MTICVFMYLVYLTVGKTRKINTNNMDELYKTLIKEARHKRVLVVSAQLHGSQKEVKLSFGASAYMYDRCRCND